MLKILSAVVLCCSVQGINAAELINHPVRKEEFWRTAKAKSLQEKLAMAMPAEVLDYMIQDNKAQGWPNIPKASMVSKEFLADLKGAIAEIPEGIQNKINEKLLGLFFVTDLGGSAYTEFVMDRSGKEFAGFTVLDIDALNRKANEWSSWKESSPFSINEGDSLVGTIATDMADNRKNALQYILLHEFGHIVSIGSPLLPRWGDDPSTLKITPAMEFFNLSWTTKDGHIVSRYDAAWKDRTKINYYAEAKKKLSGESLLSIYKVLESTNFPTLYAATNPSDDFAESFANYIHVVKLKKPWKISIKVGEKRLNVNPCWSATRCKDKVALMERILR